MVITLATGLNWHKKSIKYPAKTGCYIGIDHR